MKIIVALVGLPLLFLAALGLAAYQMVASIPPWLLVVVIVVSAVPAAPTLPRPGGPRTPDAAGGGRRRGQPRPPNPRCRPRRRWSSCWCRPPSRQHPDSLAHQSHGCLT